MKQGFFSKKEKHSSEDITQIAIAEEQVVDIDMDLAEEEEEADVIQLDEKQQALLDKVKQSPYAVFCRVLENQLNQANLVGHIFATGKIELNTTGRERLLNYGLNGVDDVSGIAPFKPPVKTLFKAIEDFYGRHVRKQREKRSAHLMNMATNSIEMTILSRTVAYCLIELGYPKPDTEEDDVKSFTKAAVSSLIREIKKGEKGQFKPCEFGIGEISEQAEAYVVFLTNTLNINMKSLNYQEITALAATNLFHQSSQTPSNTSILKDVELDINQGLREKGMDISMRANATEKEMNFTKEMYQESHRQSTEDVGETRAILREKIKDGEMEKATAFPWTGVTIQGGKVTINRGHIYDRGKFEIRDEQTSHSSSSSSSSSTPVLRPGSSIPF